MARVIGLAFSLIVAGLTAWVGWGWSELYVAYVRGDEDFTPIFYLGDHASQIVLSCLAALLGFTLGSLVYRQALDLSREFISDLRRMPARDKAALVLGVFIGLGLTALLATLLLRIEQYGPPLVALLAIASVYLGVVIMLSMKEEITFFFPGARQPQDGEEPGQLLRPKLLDTNVIIDGRIADIARAGFMEGPVYVPDFVLKELHLIADSSDTLKRNRGRRGLDILNQMQEESGSHIRVYDQYSRSLRGSDPVDTKLVQLAKDLDGAIVTNDFNLNKVAQLQGVPVLNVNELANAVKPVVLPGEEMTVTIVREGKEPEQGVAYLDDGTMVVVEHGKGRMGTTLTIVVTSVLQTVAGKMIFGHPQDDSRDYREHSNRRSRPDSSSGPRRKTPQS
ncbi:MAG: TRAM domain-containing protein [Armatimonadota bacterium]|nr:TRAM domain-containing protein [Armatimonadota bacterium]